VAASRRRTCLARLPKTNSIASMTLDLPLPLGPTTDEKFCSANRCVVVTGVQQTYAQLLRAVDKQLHVALPTGAPRLRGCVL